MGIKLPLVAISIALAALAAPHPSSAQSVQPNAVQKAPVRSPSRENDWTRAAKVLKTANSWRAGDILPPELRRFHESGTKEPNPMDTWDLIAQVDNLPLLAALVIDRDASPECREDALLRGIEAGGPNRFFELLRLQLPAAESKDFGSWIKEVRERMARPYAVVNALCIPYEDMSQNEAFDVLAKITGDLRRGVSWSDVYERYSQEFSYPPDPKNGDSTKIGLLGRLIVFPDPSLGSGHMATHTFGDSQTKVDEWEGKPLPIRLLGMARFDPAHLSAILKAKVGDVVSLPSDLNHEYVLYQVEETYRGE